MNGCDIDCTNTRSNLTTSFVMCAEIKYIKLSELSLRPLRFCGDFMTRYIYSVNDILYIVVD